MQTGSIQLVSLGGDTEGSTLTPTPAPGRVVHYVMPNGEHRPATIVRTYEGKFYVNLTVLLDGENDRGNLCDLDAMPPVVDVPTHLWRGSVTADFTKYPITGTWHWPERA